MSRKARCSECRRTADRVIVFIRLRRGLLCNWCVESAVGTLRTAGIDLTRLCPLCPRKYGTNDEPRAEARAGEDGG